MTVKQILKAAKALLVKRGWVQEEYSNANGYCLLGAISKAAAGSNANPAFVVVRRVLRIKGLDTIAGWNDRPDRTKEEVLKVLDRAIQAKGRAK